MQPPMQELVTLLEAQLDKEHFWEADAGTLARIGELLTTQDKRYVSLIADHIALDELDAMEIPKVIPEERDDLPEIDLSEEGNAMNINALMMDLTDNVVITGITSFCRNAAPAYIIEGYG